MQEMYARARPPIIGFLSEPRDFFFRLHYLNTSSPSNIFTWQAALENRLMLFQRLSYRNVLCPDMLDMGGQRPRNEIQETSSKGSCYEIVRWGSDIIVSMLNKSGFCYTCDWFVHGIFMNYIGHVHLHKLYWCGRIRNIMGQFFTLFILFIKS